MKNQLTFAHVTGALLDNKIKTYPQHRLVRDLFSLCLLDEAADYGEASDDNITFSRWCNGARPVPVDILNEYKNDTGRNQMITDFKNKIIPNLINVSNTRYLLEDMINNSRKIIGITKADELIAIDDNATFFTDVLLYIVSIHISVFIPFLANLISICPILFSWNILILFNVINIPFLNIFHIISIFTFGRIISTIKIPYIIITMSLHNR